MKLNRILILSLILAILLCGCGTKVNETLKTNDVVSPNTANNNISAIEYDVVAENDKYVFSLNKNTTAFKVTDKSNGYEWFSTVGDTQSVREADAPFTISFVNEAGLIENMNAMTDSISKGQYKIENVSDGAKITYSLGEYDSNLLIPYALTKERKEEISKGIKDSFKANQFEIMYQYMKYDRLDDKNKEKFSAMYPTLKDEPLYILRDSISGSKEMLKQLADTLSEAGYTEKMYEEDSKYFNLAEEGEKKAVPQFRVQLVYKLTDNGLTVTVPQKEIQMNSEFPLVEIELLKYFGSPSVGEEGYFLLPDGSGSIMNFYNGRGELQNYSINIYGNDKAIADNENIYTNQQAYLPLWGIKQGDNAVLAVIEKGAAIATLNAYPGGDRLSPYAAATFKLRAHYRSYTNSANNTSNYFVSIENQRYNDDLVVNYAFLNNENANYKGMAQYYRNQLFESTENSKKVSSGAVVELVGLIDYNVSVVGVQSSKKVALTDYEAVGKIAEELNASGIKNLNIKYSGWANGSYYGSYSNKVSFNKMLGSKDDFIDLNEKLSKLNDGFYPDTELQYTYKTSMLDGFSTSSDVSTLISKSKGYLIKYNPATFMRDPEYKKPAYINNPDAVVNAFEGFFNGYSKLKIDSVSLRSIGKDLNADYNDTDGVGRENALNMTVNSLNKISNYQIMVNGSNAYALPFADYLCDIPLNSAAFDNTDESVPFVQMVISGKIGYSGPAINLAGDKNETVLRMAAVGADPYYMLSAENSDEVMESEYSFLYSSNYGYLKDSMVSLIKDYQNNMTNVIGQEIVSYEKLSDRLYSTKFANGYEVIVNYNDREIQLENEKYAPKSYSVVKGEN